MILFAFALLPVSIGASLQLMPRKWQGWWHVIMGLASFFPSFLLLVIIKSNGLQPDYTKNIYIFLYYWLTDLALPVLFSLLFWHLCLAFNQIEPQTPYKFLWFAAFFSLLIITRLAYWHRYFGLYELFYLPLIYLCLTVFISACPLSRTRAVFWTQLLTALTLIPAFTPYFAITNYPFLALAALGLFLVSFIILRTLFAAVPQKAG